MMCMITGNNHKRCQINGSRVKFSYFLHKIMNSRIGLDSSDKDIGMSK